MGNLECAQQAFGKQFVRRKTRYIFSIEKNFPRSWRKQAGDDVKERGFASPVGADQPGNRAPFNGERRVFNGMNAAKLL